MTNKTVSRWETGRYMPDLDTIPVLCDELGITANELLCGEKLDENYKEKADENVMDVLAVNKSINKRKLLCDILTGVGAGIIYVCFFILFYDVDKGHMLGYNIAK